MRVLHKILSVLLPGAVLVACSAQEKDPGSRIRVTASDGAVLKKTLYVPVEGGASTLSVQADEDLDIFYKEAVDAAGGWFRIKEIQHPSTGQYLVSYESDPRVNTLELRSGTLSMVSSASYMGVFLQVRQGFESIWEEPSALSLTPGQSWSSDRVEGISAASDVWISFVARADKASDGGAFVTFPLTVSVSDGAYFADTQRTTYVVDVAQSDSFESTSFYKLHLSNGGKVFSSETTISFSLPEGKSPAIHVGELRVYEVPVEGNGITGIAESDE